MDSILLNTDGAAAGATLSDGTEIRASTVLVNADPFVLQKLAGPENFPDSFNSFIDGLRRDGSTMKVNLALRDLPTFTCLPEPVGQHFCTTHLLPDETVVIDSLTKVHQYSVRALDFCSIADSPTLTLNTNHSTSHLCASQPVNSLRCIQQ